MTMNSIRKTLGVASNVVFLAGSLLTLTGCAGGGATFQNTGNKTLGQELVDLQQSYDKGILTEKEYEDTKRRMIKKYTH